MNYSMEELKKQAKKYADELDLEGLMDSIDFSKVDAKKLKKIDFSQGVESARHQLDQLPKVRVTTQPEESDGGFLGGVILGVILGAILALLFAPRSGQDTREMVAQTVGDLKDKVGGETEEFQTDVSEAVDVATDEAEDVFSNDEPAIERNFG